MSALRRKDRARPLSATYAPPDFAREARREAATAGVLNVGIGLWVVASTWIITYNADHARQNAVAVGLAIAIVALTRAVRPTPHPMLALLNVALGAWLLASAFSLDPGYSAAWNVGIAGVAVVIVALYGLTAAREAALAEAEARRWSRGTWQRPADRL